MKCLTIEYFIRETLNKCKTKEAKSVRDNQSWRDGMKNPHRRHNTNNVECLLLVSNIRSECRLFEFKLQRWFHKWFFQWMQSEIWTLCATIIIYICCFYLLLLCSFRLRFFFSLVLFLLLAFISTQLCDIKRVEMSLYYYYLLPSMKILIVIVSKWCIIQIECSLTLTTSFFLKF